MKTPQSIMVVISGKRTKHAALERAIKFAEYNDVHIHLFNSIYEPVMELTDILSSDHRKEMKKQYLADRNLYMKELQEGLTKRGIKTSIYVTWHRELHEAIEEAVIELQPDLVIKRITHDSETLNPFAMPIDSHLLRYCPAPLLLVNKAGWTDSPVLAAIDPTTEDQAHMQLNHQVMEHTTMLAHLNETSVHAVNTYEVPIMATSFAFPDYDNDRVRGNTKKWHLDKMNAFVKPYQLAPEQIHVAEGRAEMAIPKTSADLEAQVVVLGTVGRTGLSGAFIGNTAERVLSKLSCEVLAIKPQAKE